MTTLPPGKDHAPGSTRGLRLLALLAVVSCTPRSVGQAAADAGASPDATVVRDEDPIVDLLHTIDATVAISSRVDNAHDHPEHLVDGKPETAWNSKTGDLTGWIAFRVPRSARVLRVEITAGFDKVDKTGDLFTMNHRIKRLRLSREGVVLAEATLDVDKRALQGIELDAPGGDFKVDVLETVPGTQKAWRELTVSEFRVWGRAGGAASNPVHLPKLAVGSLDGVPPPKVVSAADPPRGPFASVAALCDAHERILGPALRSKWGEDAFPIAERYSCSKRDQLGLSPASFRGGPFEDAAFLHIADLDWSHTVLVLKTAKGWFRTDVDAGTRHNMDPGCQDAVRNRFEDVTFASTSTGQSVAIVRLVQRETIFGQLDPKRNGSETRESAYACRVDTDLGVRCEGPKRLATTHEPLGVRFDSADERFFAIELERIAWGARKKPVLGPAGDLRIE